jgi:hypothetical protein
MYHSWIRRWFNNIVLDKPAALGLLDGVHESQGVGGAPKEVNSLHQALIVFFRHEDNAPSILALAGDIENYASKNGIPLHPTQIANSQIVITNARGARACIKIASAGEGPDWFTFSSESK